MLRPLLQLRLWGSIEKGETTSGSIVLAAADSSHHSPSPPLQFSPLHNHSTSTLLPSVQFGYSYSSKLLSNTSFFVVSFSNRDFNPILQISFFWWIFFSFQRHDERISGETE